MSTQEVLPGTTPASLSDQIRALVTATKDRINALELELATAKASLKDAKAAISGAAKKPRAKKAKAAPTKKRRGGRPKGSKNKPKTEAPAAETPAEG